MATVYQVLRLLAAQGWRQRYRIGTARVLEHPARPGVLITVRGRVSRSLMPEEIGFILAIARIKGSDL